MKLGLEWIISVTSNTNIPHRGVKVSIDFYKSVKSAAGSCNLPKTFRILDFVKFVTRERWAISPTVVQGIQTDSRVRSLRHSSP